MKKPALGGLGLLGGYRLPQRLGNGLIFAWGIACGDKIIQCGGGVCREQPPGHSDCAFCDASGFAFSDALGG